MNHAIFVMVVGLGVAMAGCAGDVDDPILPTPAPEAQREPPGRALSTDLRDREALLMSGIEIERLDGVPPEQDPVPGPTPEKPVKR